MELPELSSFNPFQAETVRADVAAYDTVARVARDFVDGSTIGNSYDILHEEFIYRMRSLFLKGEDTKHEDYVPETLHYQFRKLCVLNLLKAWGAKLMPWWKPAFVMEDGSITEGIARTFNVSRFCPHHSVPPGQQHVTFMFPSKFNHSTLNNDFYPHS